nr:hypothetical protein BaRGS_013965 [Batillaria attramentaria]
MVMDKSKPLPTSLQSDFLPDDVLFALTQPPIPKDKLGPPTRARNLDTTGALARTPAANMWSFKRRERYRHLLDNTTCSCGAGSDVSFLYDVPQELPHAEKPDNLDRSAVRKDELPQRKALHLPDTLIPDEYHVVKNKGVMGIEYHEDKYTTNPDDHEKHLIVFPSTKPTSRYEVIQLQKTMEEMLEKLGFNDKDVEVRGPTQMHNLLELIKKEQNIYNIVFHELIRQVTVECVERGELLSDLRGKYSSLLNKIPQQIMSLHEEVMAQRALDRRLTDELMRFKNTISVLTHELSEVKEHDRVVTREAQKTQEDLRQALAEAQKNAALLSEYHDLYELQRRRLERQVFVLSEEREIWSTAAYCLALKVTQENKLITAKRLHVSEKGWAKLANHFTILLSDKDTDLLTKIQGHVETWRDLIEDFNIALRQREEDMKESLKTLKVAVQKWIVDFQYNCFNKDGHLVKAPDTGKMRSLKADMAQWEEMLSKESDVFGGDMLLSNQEELSQIRKEMEGWTDNALKVFSRHRGLSGTPHQGQKSMMQLNEEVEALLLQYQHRITGENGVAAIVIHLQNAIESWDAKLSAAIAGSIPIRDTDWSNFYQLLDEWVLSLETVILYVGTTEKDEDRQEQKPHVRNPDGGSSMDIHDVVRKTQKWATTSSNSIDSEDAKLVEQVSTLHSEMVRWMVQTLLRLAPDKAGNSKQAGEMALLGSVSIPQLHENAKSLFETLQQFSNYVTLCCSGIVMENTQQRQDNMEENADHELRDLRNLRSECEDWIHTAKILMSHLTGESIEELFPRATSKATSRSERESITYHDHEKLQPQEPEEQPSLMTVATSESVAEAAEQPAEPVSEVSPDEEPAVAEEKDEADSGEEKPQAPPQEEKDEVMEYLGDDDNTYVTGLKDKDREEVATRPVVTAGAPDTKKAYEALAAVHTLQDQLIVTEQRAQEAEERAAATENELIDSQEKVRALQRQIQKLEAQASELQVSLAEAQSTISMQSQINIADFETKATPREEKSSPDISKKTAKPKTTAKSAKKK